MTDEQNADAPVVDEVVEETPVADDSAAVEAVKALLAKSDEVPDEAEPEVSEEDAADEPVETPVVPDADEPPQFDEQLLRDAEMVGFSRQEALEFGSPKLLDKAVTRIIQTAQQYAPPPQEQAPSELDTLLEKLADTDEYDETLSKAIRGLAAENKELKRYLADVSRTTQDIAAERMQQEAKQHVDGFLSNMDSLGHADLFGEDSDKATDTQWDNRMEVWHTAMDLEAGYRRRGQKVSGPDITRRAVQAVFGDKLEGKTLQTISNKVKHRSSQTIGRATQRQGSDLSPEERAVQAVAAQMKEIE